MYSAERLLSHYAIYWLWIMPFFFFLVLNKYRTISKGGGHVSHWPSNWWVFIQWHQCIRWVWIFKTNPWPFLTSWASHSVCAYASTFMSFSTAFLFTPSSLQKITFLLDAYCRLLFITSSCTFVPLHLLTSNFSLLVPSIYFVYDETKNFTFSLHLLIMPLGCSIGILTERVSPVIYFLFSLYIYTVECIFCNLSLMVRKILLLV